MIKMFFGTERLVCKPLVNSSVECFRQIVVEDELVRKFFPIKDVNEFMNSLKTSECFPCAVFRLSPGRTIDSNVPLVGYINGYIYSTGELLVESFIAEKYRRQGYASELLRSYLLQCRKIGFHSFRFEIEDDSSIGKKFMSSFGTCRCEEEDFTDDARKFCVYKITY